MSDSAKQIISLPSMSEAEQAVIACSLADPKAAAFACDGLSPLDFQDPRNRIIFKAMQRIHAAGDVVDSVSITDRMKLDKTFEDAGGADYMFELVQGYVAPDNVSFYAKKLRNITVQRNFILTMRKMETSYAEDPSEDPLEYVAKCKAAFDEVACRGVVTEFQRSRDIAPETVEKLDKARKEGRHGLTGLDTGFADLNAITHGWQAGDLIVVAGRPSMGKSAIAGNFAANACKAGSPVAFFSIEMTSSQIITRLEAAESGVPLERITSAVVTDAEFERVKKSADEIGGFPLYFDDKSAGLLADVVADSDRIKMADEKLGLIIVDYVNIMTVGKRMESRQAEVSVITRTLKRLAMSLKTPIILLAQLNRDADAYEEGQKPTMAMLKESGSLEQDADVVILLHRDSYYQARKIGQDEPPASVTDVIVAKNRNGRIGTANLVFQRDLSRFSNCTKDFAHKKETAATKTADVED